MWSAFPLVYWRPVNSNQGWIAAQFICQAVYFKSPDWLYCSSQRDCFGKGYVPKGGVLGMWQIETWAPGEVCVFVLIRQWHRYSHHLCTLWCAVYWTTWCIYFHCVCCVQPHKWHLEEPDLSFQLLPTNKNPSNIGIAIFLYRINLWPILENKSQDKLISIAPTLTIRLY